MFRRSKLERGKKTPCGWPHPDRSLRGVILRRTAGFTVALTTNSAVMTRGVAEIADGASIAFEKIDDLSVV
jgi:hypothetical protein